MRRILLGAAASALLFAAACADNNRSAAVESAAAVSATVAAVNRSARTVDLTTEDGEFIRMTAPPEMRNFDQIEPGDVATLEMFGSMEVRVADPGAPAEPQTMALLGRAPDGARPGAVAGFVTSLTVRFVSYDPATFRATVIMPDGEQVVVPVEPGMRAFAAARTQGERIEVTFTDAAALFVDAPDA